MAFLVALQVAICVALPLALAARLWHMDRPSLAPVLIAGLELSAVVWVVWLIGRWDMAGYWLRPAVPVLALAALVRAAVRHRSRPWAVEGARDYLGAVVPLVLVTGAVLYLGPAAFAPEATRNLALPLRGDTFVSAQGGGNALLNRHAGHEAQRYAVDILALLPSGFRAAGLMPKELAAYAAWDSEVVAPCAGRVVSVARGFPDLVPPDRDREDPAGNSVVLDCEGLQVEIAHLRDGSLVVGEGEEVQAGGALGRVGNSGNTTEPHLHIHAVDPATGQGVPITLGGKWPRRNRLWLSG